jgi:hypothetical protein
LDRLSRIRKGGEVTAGFEFVLPDDLNKKRLVVHVTMVERTKELPDPVSRSVASRKIVQHNDPFSPRAQVVCRVTLPMDPSPPDTRIAIA